MHENLQSFFTSLALHEANRDQLVGIAEGRGIAADAASARFNDTQARLEGRLLVAIALSTPAEKSAPATESSGTPSTFKAGELDALTIKLYAELLGKNRKLRLG